MTKARDLANAGTALTSVSATELGYLDGVTSAVQTQLNAKQAVVSGVNDTEIGYLDGVTSAIQTQLNAKAVYPSQTGNSGKYLTTDGTNTSWGTVSSGGMTLLSTTSLSGVTTTISSISQDYKHLLVILKNVYTSGGDSIYMRLDGDSGSNYYHNGVEVLTTTVTSFQANGGTQARIVYGPENLTGRLGQGEVWLYNYTSTSNHSYFIRGFSGNGGTNKAANTYQGYHVSTSALDSMSFNGNADSCSGTVYIYGVN